MAEDSTKNELRRQLLFEVRKEAIKRFAEKGDILNWGKYLFPDKFSLPFCKRLHNYMIDTFEETLTRTLAPRGHAKTTIEGFLLPMFYGLERPDVYQHFLNVQNTSTKAINLNVSMKTEFENNEMLIALYGDMRALEEKWTEKSFVLKNGVVFSCVGAGESIRGMQYKNKRPDCIIADDLYDDEDINNAQRVEKKNRWFWSTLYPARAKSKKHAVHIQGTAISKVDLMHTSNDTKVFKIVDKDDNILWQDLWSKDDIAKEKEAIGSIIFSREYMNEVRDDESSIIKEAWIQPYKHSELIQTGKKLTKICALDPACGEKELNDFSGYCILCVDELYNVYIQRVAEMKNSFNANMNCIDQWNERYNPNIFAIEAISGFKQLTQEVRRTKNIRLKETTCVKDKISRLEAQSFRFENGKVFINTEMDKKEYDNLVEQLINNYPVHDDVRDSVVLAMEQISKPTGVRVRRLG
jgi:phage terminase large subunit-like protein